MRARRHITFTLILAGLSLFPATAFAFTLPNFLSRISGSSGSLIAVIVSVATGFVAMFALLAFGFLIFNAYKLVIARDNPEALKSAKDGIFNAVLGFVFALLAFTIISAVSSIFNGTGANELATPNTLNPPISVPGNDFEGAFTTLLQGFLGIAFITATVMLVLGGYRMITAGGNEEAITSGKTIVKWAIAGMLVIILAYTIISAINSLIVNGTV